MGYDRAPTGDQMFSTLLGPLPAVPADIDDAGDAVGVDDGASDASQRRIDDVAALESTGLELVSDGGEPANPTAEASSVVARWAAAADAAGGPVKALLLGPWSATRADGSDPEAAAEHLRGIVSALAAAGCPFIEIAEPDAGVIAADPSAAERFGAAHRRLIDGNEGVHCSLTLTGPSVDGVELRHLFDAGYASFAFDLIAGPDNWRVIAHAPADRGIICGALGFAPGSDETREVLVWAAHYAASTSGRGLARVGLANAPAPQGVPIARADALRKLALVAEASRLAGVETGELARHLDRRAIDPRSVTTGRFAPARRRRS
jgi:hypothetical protein